MNVARSVKVFLAAVLVVAVSGLFLGLASPAFATLDVAGWKFKDLRQLQIPVAFGLAFDAGHIAWAPMGGTNVDVFVADTSTGAVTQVTDTATIESSVAMAGTKLAWISSASSDPTAPADLVLYDLATRTSEVVAHARFWEMGRGGPWIAGEYLAWVQLEIVAGETVPRQALYVRKLGTAATVKVVDRVYAGGGGSSSGDTSVGLDGSHVAFLTPGAAPSEYGVWLYDIPTGTTTRLGTAPGESRHVSLAGDLVTWMALPAHTDGGGYPTYDIQLYRISTGKTETIAQKTGPEAYPKTDGRFVVWDTYEGGDTYQSQLRKIRAYDSASDAVIDVSQNGLLNFTPEISDGIVVWERGGERFSQIMAHDLLTGQTTQLSDTRGLYNQASSVHGRTVVWWALSGDDYVGALTLGTAPVSFADPFADVGGAHRYRTAVEGLQQRGIAGGYQSGSQVLFRPDAPLLRAQFAKMVCEAFAVPVTEGLTSPFTDLGPNDPLSLYPNEYVAALASRGIIQGKTATLFNPFGQLTRGQAVSILVRALDKLRPWSVSALQAEAPGAYHWDAPHGVALKRAYANDLLTSLIDWLAQWGAYDVCTRGEAAQMIWNALSLLDQESRP
jgi:Tol biopolymer transport system component